MRKKLMTDQNSDHARLPAGDHNYWRESYVTRPYYQEAQLTTPDLDYDRDFSTAYELGHRARAESEQGTQFEDVEGGLEQKWEELKAESRLKWEHAKQAIKDAWNGR
jgi:hypothetical protein